MHCFPHPQYPHWPKAFWSSSAYVCVVPLRTNSLHFDDASQNATTGGSGPSRQVSRQMASKTLLCAISLKLEASVNLTPKIMWNWMRSKKWRPHTRANPFEDSQTRKHFGQKIFAIRQKLLAWFLELERFCIGKWHTWIEAISPKDHSGMGLEEVNRDHPGKAALFNPLYWSEPNYVSCSKFSKLFHMLLQYFHASLLRVSLSAHLVPKQMALCFVDEWGWMTDCKWGRMRLFPIPTESVRHFSHMKKLAQCREYTKIHLAMSNFPQWSGHLDGLENPVCMCVPGDGLETAKRSFEAKWEKDWIGC